MSVSVNLDLPGVFSGSDCRSKRSSFLPHVYLDRWTNSTGVRESHTKRLEITHITPTPHPTCLSFVRLSRHLESFTFGFTCFHTRLMEGPTKVFNWTFNLTMLILLIGQKVFISRPHIREICTRRQEDFHDLVPFRSGDGRCTSPS